jgi:hypothetical protein
MDKLHTSETFTDEAVNDRPMLPVKGASDIYHPPDDVRGVSMTTACSKMSSAIASYMGGIQTSSGD